MWHHPSARSLAAERVCARQFDRAFGGDAETGEPKHKHIREPLAGIARSRAAIKRAQHESLTETEPVEHAMSRCFRSQKATRYGRIDVGAQALVERVLAHRWRSQAPQQRHASLGLSDREFQADSHAARDALNRIAHVLVRLGDQVLQSNPDFGGDGDSEVVLVAEMVEETAFCDSGGCDHIIDGNCIDRTIDEQVEAGGNQGGSSARSAGESSVWLAMPSFYLTIRSFAIYVTK
ncbi:MAG: hypothetical protein M0D54_00065 [Hyphomonadaceae bacterium JAD_PAG50586_4]|nr:MAG: hypothetical protein M0D54_00065 [Hyphomonadaceae bacterium JAD_PAG50586_4]